MDSLKEIHNQLDEKIGISQSFDAGYREFKINNRKLHFYYITGLVDSNQVIQIYQTLMMNIKLLEQEKFNEYIENNLVHQQVEKLENLDDFSVAVMSGMLGLIFEGSNYYYCIDLRSYPGRGPEEPDTERVVRGSRDGFTENIIINTALTRRRIRTGKLVNKLFKVGKSSQTDIVISYIDQVVDKEALKLIEERINNLSINELTMSDKELFEIIANQGISPYPKVRFTERPDIVASHLYQGQIAIFIDTSPSVVIAPITFFDHLHHAEEYRQTPLIGTFLRLMRYIGIFASIFLVPFWLMLVLNPELIPSSLSYIGPQEESNIPIFYQFLIAEIGIEFLRMAAIHTPNPISTAMGIIAGVLIGDIAISVGLFQPEVVLYTAVSQVGSYATPSYELALANKVAKLFFILAVYFFGPIGLLIAILIWIIYLASMKSFNKRYLYPFIPFSFKNFIKIFIRFPKKNY